MHELVKGGHEPRYNLGKSLEVWLESAAILSLIQKALSSRVESPFGRLLRLKALKELIPDPCLRIKIDGIVELAGPRAKRVNPPLAELRREVKKESRFLNEALRKVDSSLDEIAEAIRGSEASL